MKNRLLPFFLLLLSAQLSLAQFTTPGTGVHWNLDSLLMYSGGAVFNGEFGYGIIESVELAENDSLTIDQPIEFQVAENVLLTIHGVIALGTAFNPLVFDSSGEDLYWGGIRLEGTAEAQFTNTTFVNGGGVKCISGNVLFTECTFESNLNLATNGAALEFFEGSPTVMDCTFDSNQGAAISSPANINCAPQIFSCHIVGNNTENSNRPQINLGPSGDGMMTSIIDNNIIGDPNNDQAGGIAVSSLFGTPCDVLIDGNYITSNRYGIALAGGNVSAMVSDNIILDNMTQGDPLLGGSGINLNGSASSSTIVRSNVISGNLWGVTVQGDFQTDLGNPDEVEASIGDNVFIGNGNGGMDYALYNNTPSPITAMNNCWIANQESTEDQVEDVIFHSIDDSSLGTVNFTPFQCGVVSAIAELKLSSIRLHPNPTTTYLNIDLAKETTILSYSITDIYGRELAARPGGLSQGRIVVSQLPRGVYQLAIRTTEKTQIGRFIKE